MVSFLFFLSIAVIAIIIGLVLLWFRFVDKDKNISFVVAFLVIAFGVFVTRSFIMEMIDSFNNIDIIQEKLKPKLIKSIVVLKANTCEKKFKKEILKTIKDKDIIKKIIKVFSKSEIFIDRPTGDSFLLTFLLKDNSEYNYYVYLGEKDTFISPIKLIYKNNILEYSCDYSSLSSSSSLLDVLKKS